MTGQSEICPSYSYCIANHPKTPWCKTTLWYACLMFCGSGPWAGHTHKAVSTPLCLGPQPSIWRLWRVYCLGPEPPAGLLTHMFGSRCWQLAGTSVGLFFKHQLWPLHGLCTWENLGFLAVWRVGSESECIASSCLGSQMTFPVCSISGGYHKVSDTWEWDMTPITLTKRVLKSHCKEGGWEERQCCGHICKIQFVTSPKI